MRHAKVHATVYLGLVVADVAARLEVIKIKIIIYKKGSMELTFGTVVLVPEAYLLFRELIRFVW